MPHRPPRALSARPILLSLLVAFGALAGCARLAEPAWDADTVAALEALSGETTETFLLIARTPGAEGRAERSAAYAGLREAAETIAARARARAPETQRAAAGRYAVATAGFLGDYRAQLSLLDAHDAERAALGLGPAGRIVALRRAAMTDALRDALFYERDALARDR